MHVKTKTAFTLIELLVVIAIIALLLSIILPALNLTRGKAKELSSMANMKSLTMAWLLYTENNDSELVSGQVWNAPSGVREYDWVHPVDPSLAMPDHEKELEGIRKGALWPYVEDEQVYHSPGDRTWNKNLGTYASSMSPYRSYAIMDSMHGCWREEYCYHKYTEIGSPGNRIVFTEEEDRGGSNWGSWVLGNPESYSWWDPLAAWYNNASASIFGFADGHAGKHVWQNQNTKDWIREQTLGHTPPASERDDVTYMHRAYHHDYK